jgi:hypothetical protein
MREDEGRMEVNEREGEKSHLNGEPNARDKGTAAASSFNAISKYLHSLGDGLESKDFQSV